MLLVQWDEVAAFERAAQLRAAGIDVEVECHDGADAYRKARQGKPDVIVLDLDHRPSHSWQTARPLAKSKSPPRLMFVGGDAAAKARAAKEAPAAAFVDAKRLTDELV